MELAKKESSFIKEHISFVEEELKKNLKTMDWKIEHSEELKSLEDKIVKIFVGITSEFGPCNNGFFSKPWRWTYAILYKANGN